MNYEQLTKADLIKLLKEQSKEEKKEDEQIKLSVDYEERKRQTLEKQNELQKERNRILRVSNGRWSSNEKMERDEEKMRQVAM